MSPECTTLLYNNETTRVVVTSSDYKISQQTTVVNVLQPALSPCIVYQNNVTQVLMSPFVPMTGPPGAGGTPATSLSAGIVELATQEEVLAGPAGDQVVTTSTLNAALCNLPVGCLPTTISYNADDLKDTATYPDGSTRNYTYLADCRIDTVIVTNTAGIITYQAQYNPQSLIMGWLIV